MNTKLTVSRTLLKRILFVQFFFCAFSYHSFPQFILKGTIRNETDDKPVAYASIGIKGKKAGGIADSSGHFKISFPSFVKKNDTVIISSLGFESIRVPVNTVISESEFKLKIFPKTLDPVTVRTFFNQNAIDINSEGFEFFRGWYNVMTGGEIGRILEVPHEEYQIEKIRFKTDNKCDTCLIRLHIREVINDLPGKEILKDNIIIPISSLTSKDKSPEFDLHDYNIVLADKKIYIGFEVINCHSEVSGIKSLCFVGTEFGQYVYKTFVDATWEKDEMYSIYVQLSLKY